MSHLADGTHQAFLDDELGPEERAQAAEHLLTCSTCRTEHDALRRANTVFSEAMRSLDVEPPQRSAPAASGRRSVGVGTFVRAAGLVLLLAAAASAAVPGSPVREWIESVVETEEPAPEPGPAPVAETPEEAPAPLPSGVAVMADSEPVDVLVSERDGMSIHLEASADESVSVTAVGATEDPVFRMRRGRVEVRGGTGGELHVRLPLSPAGGRLMVDGRVYAEAVDGRLEVRAPGEAVDGATIWP